MDVKMEYQEDIAIMVYNYLIEQRLMLVAEQFAKVSLYLPQVRRGPGSCMFLTTPYRSLQEVVREYISLHRNMKSLLKKYHKEVRLPYEKTTWDKVEHVVDFFHSQLNYVPTPLDCSITAGNANPSEGNLYPNPGERFPADVQYQQYNVQQNEIELQTSQQAAPIVYQREWNANSQQMAMLSSQLDEAQFVYQLDEAHRPLTVPAGEAVVEESTASTHQPMLLYLVNNGEQQCSTNGETFVLTMVNGEGEMAECNPAVDLHPYHDDVTIGQHVEISTELAGSNTPYVQAEHTAVPSIDLPSLPLSSAGGQSPAEAKNPPPAQSPAAVDSAVKMMQLQPAQQTPARPSEPGTATLSSIECTPLKQSARKPIDPTALEEWKRIRSVNKSNFDNYVREANYQDEVRNRMAVVLMEKQKRENTASTKPSANPRGPKSKQTVVRSAVKTKVNRRSGTTSVGQIETQQQHAKKSPANTLDNDTSDFISSSEEDEDVRSMSRKVCMFRRRQKKANLAKEGSTEESTTFTSPASLQCRINLFAGRAPLNTTAKRTIRKRTPSTSSGSTPVKRPKRQPQPSPMRPGATQQQVTQAKRVTKAQCVPGAESVPLAVVVPPANNRRPVRACTAAAAARRNNEEKAKPTGAITPQPSPRKQPNGENVPPPTSTGKEAPAKVSTPAKQSAEKEPPTPVEVEEAAIYAVLNQLHGND
uniref:Uncharacterized protein n=1 Tax=Anopheles epiroticus TaxID=199890 RepID=A0A182P7X6_9DIPT